MLVGQPVKTPLAANMLLQTPLLRRPPIQPDNDKEKSVLANVHTMYVGTVPATQHPSAADVRLQINLSYNNIVALRL